MSAHPHAHIVQLGQFQTAHFLADAATRSAGGAPPPGRHPEAAGTPCQCCAPEPCWTHDPALGILPAAAAAAAELVAAPVTAPVTAPMAAIALPPLSSVTAGLVSTATAEAGAALAEFADGDSAAPTACQCVAPLPCTAHPDERPLIARPPAWNEPHPDSPVARTARRLAHDRAAGVLPGAEPGQGTGVLPYLTDHELGAWTQAVLAEHHRRQSRFADYRRGAAQAQHRLDRKDAS